MPESRISIPRAVVALFDRDLAALEDDPDRLGGEPPEDPTPFYIEVARVPGGRWGRLDGYDVLDIDVYGRDYDLVESVALDIEALLLGYPHSVRVEGQTMVLDSVEQNVGPADRPWEDDSVYRIGATYVITARRR